jgi:hypothetical protein
MNQLAPIGRPIGAKGHSRHVAEKVFGCLCSHRSHLADVMEGQWTVPAV